VYLTRTRKIRKKEQMKQEEKPLYTLTVEEYITLTKKLIEEAINQKQAEILANNSDTAAKEDVFDIRELAKFLRCSKVSIHNYKKLGMPFYRIGRKLLFKKIEVLNFMQTIKTKRFKLAS
jgi:hypothetical protein